jgi:putative tryptophan/tyrosine transport system substrate-binding protein
MAMKRREFIAGRGGAVAWPLAARAQQSAMPVVGFLHLSSPLTGAHRGGAFLRGLSEAGFVAGQNVTVEYRWAEEHPDRLSALAAELVSQNVNVIVAAGSIEGALAAKEATPTIPIAFGVPADPVKFGLVKSLARPGGNATGINYFTVEVLAKRLGLLHEIVPRASRVAVLINPADTTNAAITEGEIKGAAVTMGLQILVFKAKTNDEIDAAFAALSDARSDALFVAPGAFFNERRVQLAILAARHAIPTACGVRDCPEAGGLMSYGTSISDMFRQVGAYAGRILKGEKPADIPVSQVTKFEFVINLRTAKALGLEVSPSLLARADEVIE